jgi:ketosteroid isomerase-like protein
MTQTSSTPTSGTARTTQELIAEMFRRCEAKDVDGAVALVAPDAVFIDPHYPRVHNSGSDEIRESLVWGIGGLEQMRFHEQRWFTAADGAVSVEVDTHHTIKGKREVRFPQVFVAESRDGLLTRLQAFEPYGPHGVLATVLRVMRAKKKLTGKY